MAHDNDGDVWIYLHTHRCHVLFFVQNIELKCNILDKMLYLF